MGLKGPRGVELLQGEQIALFASAARTATAGTNGTAAIVNGERIAIGLLLKVTAAGTDAADTLDVYVDFLGPDGTTWLNAVHFEQVIGTDAAESQYVLLIPNSGSTTVTQVGSDAAAGTVRPNVFGSQIRGRYVLVDADADGGFTFSLYAYAL